MLVVVGEYQHKFCFFSMQLTEPHSKFCLLVQIPDNMECTIAKVHMMGIFVFNFVNLVHNGNGNNFGSFTRYESVLWVLGSQNGLRGNCYAAHPWMIHKIGCIPEPRDQYLTAFFSKILPILEKVFEINKSLYSILK